MKLVYKKIILKCILQFYLSKQLNYLIA